MGTAYPGERCEVGGEQGLRFFDSVMTLVLPLDGRVGNTCEYAMMFDLLPISLIMAAIVLIKEKKKDLCIILMLIVTVFLGIYSIWGFPEILAKITLLSKSMGSRVVSVMGIEIIYILIMSLSQVEFKFSKKSAFVLAEVLSVIFIAGARYSQPEYVTLMLAIIVFILLTVIYYFALRANQDTNKFVVVMLITMLMCGALVNPINIGTDGVLDGELGTEIKNIVEEDTDSLWAVEGIGYPYINYPMMFGAKTINSTNVYPTLDRWKQLDTEGKYEEIYNRYAHINVVLDENCETPEFTLTYADSFEVRMNLKTLRDVLKVSYIVTGTNYDDTYDFEKLYTYNNATYIYKIK
jgi:hypothetical protein